ncbi:MAG: hypothetical protein CMJ42_05165 [Phyllobacteriaceae bacterium]|nr:hypothetical protein [Phyllobacteriaceae bacterium]MBA91210.1 hypothetical protein [Phyllobacteriaceae bacterium]
MAIGIPRGAMLRIADVRIDLRPEPHPFELANERAIAETWTVAKAAKPALFNGLTTLVSAAEIDGDGILRGNCHFVRYATLLHWIRHPEPEGAEHVFAHAVPESAEGRFIAIRMGQQTVNAGRCYFAAGSIDASDIVEGRIDIKANMAREVREETGLLLEEAVAERGFHLWRGHGYAVLLRRYRFARDADELASRVRAHVANEQMPEIVGPVVLAPGERRPERLAPHMDAVLDWLEMKPDFLAT